MILLGALLAGCSTSKTPSPQTVVFFGDSLTEGVGVALSEAYPALIQEKINEQTWPITIVSAGVRGNTTADGVARITEVLSQNPQIDIFVLALGANDILQRRSPVQMEENLNTILEQVKKQFPNARLMVAGIEFGLVLGMLAPRDMDEIFERVAEKHDAELIPSLLKGVVGKRDLNTGDGIHPNAAGHRVIAKTIWEELEPNLVRR